MNHHPRRSRANLEALRRGPSVDTAVIVAATPLTEVRDYLDTPAKVASWFNAVIDDDAATLTIGTDPDPIIVRALHTETLDGGCCQTITGILPTGPIGGYLTLRPVACDRRKESPTGIGTEIWAHLDLAAGTLEPAVSRLYGIIRKGLQHLRDELGT